MLVDTLVYTWLFLLDIPATNDIFHPFLAFGFYRVCRNQSGG